MGTCNILRDVWNRKSTQPLLYFIFYFGYEELNEDKIYVPNLTI
jgi:hypothetical protein